MTQSMDDLMGAIARGWCTPDNAHKEMDADLAIAIAQEVHEYVKKVVLAEREACAQIADKYHIPMSESSADAIAHDIRTRGLT